MCCNIPGPGLDLASFEDLIQGCTCKTSCGATETTTSQTCDPQTLPDDTQASECSCMSQFGCVYDENGCLTPLSLDSPSELPLITECNSRCSCPNACRNRVVQKGIRYKLEVFNHEQKGLCLRTLELIKKLTFICEYAGEVLTYEEAKTRAVNQTEKDMNYIFVLREHFSSGELVTYVDPCKRGNIGRFLNHSCEPNSFIVPFRVENMVPKLCVFALRDINSGEEITYEYGSCSSGDNRKGSVNDTPSRTACHCMSEHCKGVLPFDDSLF